MYTLSGGSWIEAILDEVALEGLEGVTLPSLWSLLARRLLLSNDPLPSNLQEQIWNLLLRSFPEKLEFYELPTPRTFMPPYDRRNDVDAEEGIPVVPEKCPFLLYPEAFVEDDKIMGNCVDYKTRKLISVDQLSHLTAIEATEKWDQSLVVVASQELRLIALTPSNLLHPDELSVQQYVFWEAIGRSRYNGMTTVGPWSLACFCKDASFVFYIKNKLLDLQVISAQSYNERHKGRFLNSNLLHLPRFFRKYKNRLQESIELLYMKIKESPSQHIPVTKIPDHLQHLKNNQVKKLLVTHLFRTYFETVQVFLPTKKSSNKFSKRKVAVLKLRNPNLKVEDLYQEVQGNDSIEGTDPNETILPNEITLPNERDESILMNSLIESNDGDETSRERETILENVSNEQQDESDFEEDEDHSLPEFLDFRHSYIDMPSEQECYEAIMRFGKRGISAAELAQYVSINLQTVRGFVKHLLKEGQIKDYTEQIGKQRSIRYVASVQGAHVDLKKVEMEKTIQELQCNDELNTPRNSEVVLKDHPEIIAIVRPIPVDKKRDKIEKQLERQVQRKTMIVRLLNENCILQMYSVMRSIQREELNSGYSDSICRRSVMRLVQPMCEANVVSAYTVSLQYGQRVRIFRMITHPKITADHELMHREVLRLKNNFHLMSEESNNRNSVSNSKEKTDLARKKVKSNTYTEPNSSKVPAPKLLLAKALHEFLHYLICELDSEQKPLEMSIELVHQWQKTEPALQPRQFLEEWETKEKYAIPYSDEISWRTFITPLPRYDEKPKGWVYFMDAMDRMPLSLFLRICRIERDAMDKLRNQLKHPVRQHYLLSQLDLTYLVPRLRIQQLYLTTLRLLNHMGLVQISERQLGCDLLQRWIYLNRRSRLLDTTTSSEHNYKRVNADHSYTELKFEFENRDEVAKYWAKLQHICVYTKLGFRKQTSQSKTQKSPRSKTLGFLAPVSFEEALELDIGSVRGDQLGAAGLDSGLYAHQFRHWSWVQNKGFKPETTLNTTNTTSHTTKSSNPGRKRMPTIARLKPTHKLQMRKSRSAQTGSQGSNSTKRKSGPRDDIDRDALRNMRTLRVAWSPQEDRLLKMGRAVYLFIDAPMTALALFNVGIVCRDIIRRYLGICNKTTQACVRRLQFLMRMKRDIPEVPNWIYSMQTNSQFNTIYNERFLANLKRDYSSKTERNEALVIHFVLILTKLHGMITNAHGTMSRQFLLPDELNDYKILFRECSPINADQQLLYRNPSTESDLQVIIALQVLHSTLCSAKDKTLFNLQTFEIYKHFSEEVLNAAFNKARADSLLVAVKRRNIQTVNRSLSGPAYLLSSKYKYRLIYLKLGYAVYDTYYNFGQKMEEDSEVQLTSPNFGQFLLMGEWLALGSLRISVQLPANILTVDTTSMSRNSGSSTDRILDHYSCIFDNAPQTEYSKRLESECSGRQASRVRFHPANLSYRLPYCPYNHLSKLPQRAMHFFCALDALGESISINNSRLEQTDSCPFAHCIMRSGNYLNAVERIVHERRPVLKELVTHAPTMSEHSSESYNSSPLTVGQSNLWGLVHHLESFWRQHQQLLECKDLGKVLADKTLHQLTDWRTICSALLDYEPSALETERTQEYEPALNKEERARAQDVFVVHLPMIRMETMDNKEKIEEAKEALNKMRKSIIDKVTRATYWTYTENSFETLRPILLAKNYDDTFIQQIKDILDYIEKQPLGVLCTELRDRFPLNESLIQLLSELNDHQLIKRVGIDNHMYVHKEHIRNWVVHTFHIKRLEREKVQNEVAATPATPQAVVGQKRKMSAEQEEDEEKMSASKKQKLLEENNTETDSDETIGEDDIPSGSKRRSRRSKPLEVFHPPSEISRDVIVMRPQPWIRVNASLNRRVLDRWLGAVLSECIARFGCTVHSLFLRFPHLVPVDIMLLLELLGDMECIDLFELVQPKAVLVETLATEWENDCTEQRVSDIYEPKDTFVRVHADAIRRLTNFIGQKKYSAEFI